MEHTREITAIIAPIDKCNLACKYCLPRSKRSATYISPETLRNSMRKFAEFASSRNAKARFIWHGGEPLLAGLTFFKEVVSIKSELEKVGYSVRTAIQTNGTLLTKEWARFLVDNDFNVGFSMDGPPAINDLTRIYPNGKSSSQKVLRGILNYKEIVGHAEVIIVLTSLNAPYIVDIYQYFLGYGIGTQFNPWYAAQNTSPELKISSKQYADAIIKLFDTWFNENTDKYAADLETTSNDLLEMLLFSKPSTCTFRKNCQSDDLYAIDAFGNVGPCSRFFGDPKFIYGNVNQVNSFQIIADSPLRKHLQHRHSRIPECKKCKFQPVCNSGCMQQAYSSYGTVNKKDPLCMAYKQIFSHVRDRIDSSLKKAETSI